MTGNYLQSGGIRLRAPEPEDLDTMFRFENDTDLWSVSNTTGPYSRYQLKQYIEQNQNDLFADRQLRFMVEDERQQVVGMIDLCNYDPMHNRAEVGMMIAEMYRGRGIGHVALNLLEIHSFQQLGIHQLFAYIATDNLSCRRLFATQGYQEAGVLKDWICAGKRYTDVVLVQKINV